MSADTDLTAYRAELREWLAANLPPRRPGAATRSAHDHEPDEVAAQRALQRRCYEAGYVGITLPREYGGQGLTPAHEQVWSEESAGFAVPAPGGVASSVTLGIILPTIVAHGSEEQKRTWVPRMLAGDDLWVQLLSEPGAGSDLAGVLTRATRDGETWVLSGSKVWSSGATSADYGICLARTDWDAPKHRGLTWFRVPLDAAGVEVRPIREINGGAEFCEEFLDDVIVGDGDVIGEINGGWPVANAMLAFERGVGRSQPPRDARSFAPDLVELAERRHLTTDGATRQAIAKAYVNDFMHGALTRRLGRVIADRTVDPSAASYIKLSHGINQPLRAIAAMEIAGPVAAAWPEQAPEDAPGRAAATGYLNGRIMSIAGGSNQIQRNIISERVLGLPREPSADSQRPFRDVLAAAKNWGSPQG